MFRIAALVLLAAAAAATPALAVELHLQFGALERMLADQVFTQEGRRYVRGSQTTKCNFAYLEKPNITQDAGRLRIKARFTGRSALNMFGQCVGLGDAFDVVITSRPIYKDGNLRLEDVKAASANKTGFYITRVCTAIQISLTQEFKYPLQSEASKVLEDTTAQPAYKRQLKSFTVQGIRVSEDALVLMLDFQLVVK